MINLNFYFILVVSCLPFIGADLYVPSIVAMAQYFSTSVDVIQLCISTLMFGVASSQLFYGPISEGIGRKPVMLFGIVLSLLGGIVCIFANHISLLFLGLFLHGIGLGAGSLFRSVMRDLYHGQDLILHGANISILNTFILTLAPFIGGYLQTTFNWQASFIFFFIFTLCTFIFCLYGYEESNKHLHQDRLKIHYILKIYQIILSHNAFAGYCLCCATTMFGYFAWITVCPVLMIKHLGYSALEFGSVLLSASFFAFILGSVSNRYAVQKFTPATVFTIGWSFSLLSGLLLFPTYWIFGMSDIQLISCMVLYIYSTSFLWPNFFALAFEPFHETSGYASALYGSSQIAGASLAAAVASLLPEQNPIPLACAVIASALFGWSYYVFIIYPYEQKELELAESKVEGKDSV